MISRPPSPPPASERESAWITAICEGRESAFEEMFLAYFDRLQAYAERYVRRSEIAEELVANVFLRIWEQRGVWTIRGSLKSYLYTAVRNQALMWIDHERVVERTRQAAERQQRSPGMGQAPPRADEELQADELATALLAAIDRLPPRSRDAYLLSRQHGLTYAQIAEEMDISPKTVEIHLGKALQALRRELAEHIA